MDRDSENLQERVVEWLAGEGYRLEYLVHKAFGDVGLTAVMGEHFENAEGQPREIDVTAFQQSDPDPGRTPLVRVLCECKYSTEKPWLLMQSGLGSHLFADWSSLPQSPQLRDLSTRIIDYRDRLEKSWHFAPGQRLAHGLVQAFRKNNQDAAFNALQKIANAAWDYVETPGRRGFHAATLLAIPCLVVEAPLFSAWFSHDRNCFSLKEVPYGRISWSGVRGGTMVDVVHITAISDYAAAIKNTFSTVLEVLEGLGRRFPI